MQREVANSSRIEQAIRLLQVVRGGTNFLVDVHKACPRGARGGEERDEDAHQGGLAANSVGGLVAVGPDRIATMSGSSSAAAAPMMK